MMNKLLIISQNLNGKLTDKTVKEYIKKKKADIYAFQELKRNRCNITDTKAVNMQVQDFPHVQQIWENAFPWIEFKSGYWKESGITFSEKEIRIINFHSSPWYSAQMRYVLLKRLEEIKDETGFVILLGDFNAAFAYQTEQDTNSTTRENDAFLTQIKSLGFTELLSKREKEKAEPHYTFYHEKKDKTIDKKKLDHIFISEGLSALSREGWQFFVEYIDDVNKSISPPDLAFTDHSGIKLTVQTSQ